MGHRIAIKDPSTVGSDINATIDSRVADDLIHSAIPVLGIGDADPGRSTIIRSECARNAIDIRYQINSRIAMARGRLAEPKGPHVCGAVSAS